MTDIDDFLAKLNPKTAALFRKASEIENRLLTTPSLGINMAIGGLGYGRIHTLWGNRSAGKSLFCLGLAREAQRKGEIVAWVDAEKNFDPEWATRNGVDPDNMITTRASSMADVADSSVDLITKGADLLIIDSMSVLLPQSYFVDREMKALADTGQIGTFAKNYGQMVNMINNLNEKTCVVFVSQVRNKISTYGAAKTLMGGEAAEFINSTIIKLWSNPNPKDDIHGEVNVGDLILKRPIGRPVTWTIDKARGPGMHMSNEYDMYFAGDSVGIDLTSEVVTYGVEYGVVRKAGNWLSYGDMEKGLNGKPAFIKYLKENPDVQDEIYANVMAKVAA